ncbi:MAG: phospholipase D-like domain-containing protein, partial [Persicimonas sp.]
IIDDRFVFVGTGNITSTGFGRNNNNWVYMDSPPVAADFRDEFEQMFNGRFSAAKEPIDNGEKYQVGDTEVEVYFSPQEDAMGTILEETEKAHTNIYFQIFAFTKDEVGSRFIEKRREFGRKNEEELGEDCHSDSLAFECPREVVGVLDRSQLHGNDQFHEGYRLRAFGVPMRLDANENSQQPGDYQAGGGRLHTKTMILDYGTEDARVLTGSFNWSAAATISNDEVLLVLRGERVVEHYMKGFREMWNQSRSLDAGMCYYMLGDDDGDNKPLCADEVGPGDLYISEVQWDGWNDQDDPSDHTGAPRDSITNDEFVELYNPTDEPINLSMWTLTNGYDFQVGFTPGTVIEPGEYFLVLDHNTVPYEEGEPQRGTHAFQNPDFVLNKANDPRFPRLDLKNASLDLELRDATGEIIDEAGDAGPAFWGGRDEVDGEILNFSMERRINEDGEVQNDDGTEEDAWKSASGETGGDNVHPDYRDFMISTPGQPNTQ